MGCQLQALSARTPRSTLAMNSGIRKPLSRGNLQTTTKSAKWEKAARERALRTQQRHSEALRKYLLNWYLACFGVYSP